ncbi:MAG: rod shape-determining protein RodA, partial [Clostridia bacterium]|nr:rod shape-determining protein RodA [Clostridia bacterium]
KKRTVGTKAPLRVDVFTIVMVAALVLFGLVTLLNVLTDPFDGTETTLSAFYERLNFEFFTRQIGNILISLVLLVPLAVFDYEKYKPFTKVAYIVCLILLFLLVVAGKNTRGALGWYEVGTRAFQPSEITKVVLIVVLSKAASEIYDRRGPISRFADFARLFLYFFVPFLLVLLQNDFGTAMVLLIIFAGILFCVRIRWRYVIFGTFALGIGAILSWMFLLTEVQKERIRVFLDPSRNPEGSGMNVLHAKQLIGSGGFWGKGYFTKGTLIQTGYVPIRHSDFIFAGIGEGVGFFGAMLLIIAFFLLLFHWLHTALTARDTFGRCLVIGCTVMLAAHIFENVAMNLGAMPVTGIPLPFISYGGSNILASFACVGIVISVYARAAGGRQL